MADARGSRVQVRVEGDVLARPELMDEGAIVEVVKEYYPDPTDASGRFGMVDVKAVRPFEQPVTLAQIKAEPSLSDLALVRQSRLSVLPVSKDEWRKICQMGKTKMGKPKG